MKKFIQYLKANRIHLFIGFWLIILCFFAYAIITDGWEAAKLDVTLYFIWLLIISVGYLIGEVIVYYKKKNR